MRAWGTDLLGYIIVYILLLTLAGSSPGVGIVSTPRADSAKKSPMKSAMKSISSGPGSSLFSSSTVPAPVAEDVPVRLLIPGIQVDAPVEAVGVLTNGDLETPQQQPWTNAGWYEASPDPGQQGSAVIDGHLDRPGGYPAVFWNLHNLHQGDVLKIIHKSGKLSTFSVTSIATYPLQEVPLQKIFGLGGGAYLNLITCAGDWIPEQRQTKLRMVVYASLLQ